jgi:hypothetical protein
MSPCISALMVPPRLRLERLGIAAMGPDEFPTTTDRADRAVFQEQNCISLADRRKAVRDEQHRWPSGSPVRPMQGTAEKALLAPQVERGRRFIVPEAMDAVTDPNVNSLSSVAPKMACTEGISGYSPLRFHCWG